MARPIKSSNTGCTSSASIGWYGQRLELRCDRTAWWAAASTLLVADPHFGKAGTFRAASVPVPEGVDGDNLARLDMALAATGATRLVFLGDLFHARGGVDGALLAELAVWRDRHASLKVLNVRGNHDRHAGDPPASLKIDCVPAGWFDPAFPRLRFVHDPAEAEAGGHGTLAGHLHPAAVLDGPGRSRMRCACFHFRPDVAVLPAFGAFTGMHPVRARRGDRVFAVGPDAVVEFISD